MRRGKRNKVRVTCEVTPHHFALTDADVGDYDSNFKMNPPLRSEEEPTGCLPHGHWLTALCDAIATDHAPHAKHEKIIEFQRAAFGITGLETALGLVITHLHRGAQGPADPHRRALYRGTGPCDRSSWTRHACARRARRRDYF